MDSSFLAYISQNHRIKFEDVATDAVAFVLQNSAPARVAFLSLIGASFLPSDFEIQTRFDTGKYGLPDLLLRDKDGRATVIVESKFTAGLTAQQPLGYLEYLRSGAKTSLLVFLVPESRIEHYSQAIGARAESIQITRATANIPRKSSISILIISWVELLAALDIPKITTSFGLFLSDLERMCEVAEPDHFKIMTIDELSNLSNVQNETAVRSRNFMSLASEVAQQSFDSIKEWAKYQNAWGATWAGVYGHFGPYEAWIGFDPSSWSEYGKSPLWLIFEKDIPYVRRTLAIDLTRDEDYFIQSGAKIAVPIPLIAGTRDEVLESCCRFVSQIKARLTDGGHTSPAS